MRPHFCSDKRFGHETVKYLPFRRSGRLVFRYHCRIMKNAILLLSLFAVAMLMGCAGYLRGDQLCGYVCTSYSARSIKLDWVGAPSAAKKERKGVWQQFFIDGAV